MKVTPRLEQRGLFEFESVASAVEKQRLLSSLVISRSPLGLRPDLVCGLDAAYPRGRGVAVAVVWSRAESSVVEKVHVNKIVHVPYLPGLLGFREGPLLTSAVRRLKMKPDVFLVDGHGVAHPRGFGLASHVGLALDRPTVGVAKSHLYGSVEGHRIIAAEGSVVGRVLQTERDRLFYVSVGHRIGLRDAVRVVRGCLVENHPAPLRLAHLEAARLKSQAQD